MAARQFNKVSVGKLPNEGTAYEKVSGSLLERKELVGIHVQGANRGKIDRYVDNNSLIRFLGICKADQSVNTTVDSTNYNDAIVEDNGVVVGGNGEVEVAGSASSEPGDPVYADGHELSDLSVTRSHIEQEQIGVLISQVGGASSTKWSVSILPSRAGYRNPAPRYPVGPKTTYTADGAIAQAAYQNDGSYIVLTGASSAQMTLADPVAQEVGNRITIHRQGGTGTHDVDFNDEEGSADTIALAADERLVLLAVNTDGYRVIG